MPEIPAEAVQAASAAIERVMQQAAHPLSYAELGKAAAAAIVEHGYAIVPATPPQALEAPQGVESSGDGMTGRLGDEKPAGTLSALREELEAARAAIHEYENTITWFTTCHGCAKTLDSSYAETVRAEKAEEALEAAQQALSRVVRYAKALNESNPVTADRIAEAILGPGDYAEGAALAALTEEKPLVVRDTELETARAALTRLREYTVHRRGCLFWVARPCDCGLAALDSPDVTP